MHSFACESSAHCHSPVSRLKIVFAMFDCLAVFVDSFSMAVSYRTTHSMTSSFVHDLEVLSGGNSRLRPTMLDMTAAMVVMQARPSLKRGIFIVSSFCAVNGRMLCFRDIRENAL